MSKQILVTGGAGYVGSYLIRKLLKNKDYKVAILDNFRFGKEPIEEIKDQIQIIEKDIRFLDEGLLDFLKQTDAVIHLAATSKEPTALYDDRYTIETNYLGTKKLAELSKKARVKKFIYASTCSVYFSYSLPEIPKVHKQYWRLDKELPLMKEDAQLNPISPYSITKRASEQLLLDMADENFHPIILRKGTIFGLSPRMRFDLVVNAMTKTSFFENKIWCLKGIFRPLVDLETVAQAYIQSLDNDLGGEIINVVDLNIDLVSLAKKIKEILPVNPPIEIKKVEVERNYRAGKDKFEKIFKVKRRPFEEAVMEVWRFLEKNPVDKEIYYNKNL